MTIRIALQAAEELKHARRLRKAGFYPQARAAFESFVDKFEHPEVRLEYGQYLAQKGETSAAIQQIQQVLESARNAQSPRLEAAALNELACVFRQRGEYTRAVTAQRRSFAVKLTHLSSDESELRTDLGNLAADAVAAGELPMAEQLLRCSLSLEIGAGSLEGQAADYGNLAIVRSLQGDNAAGVKLLRRAMRLHRQLRDERSVGCDLLNLAAFYESRGCPSRSRRLLTIAVRILRGIAATDLLSRAEAALARAERTLSLQWFDPTWN